MRRRRHDRAQRWRRAEVLAGSAGESVDEWERLLDRHAVADAGPVARALWPDRGRLVEYLAADPLTQFRVANDLAVDEVAGP